MVSVTGLSFEIRRSAPLAVHGAPIPLPSLQNFSVRKLLADSGLIRVVLNAGRGGGGGGLSCRAPRSGSPHLGPDDQGFPA